MRKNTRSNRNTMVKKNRYIPGSILHINDLLPWFLEDHGTLPASYLKSTQKFFNKLQASSDKLDKSTGKL
jgi:hypothetical protein